MIGCLDSNQSNSQSHSLTGSVLCCCQTLWNNLEKGKFKIKTAGIQCKKLEICYFSFFYYNTYFLCIYKTIYVIMSKILRLTVDLWSLTLQFRYKRRIYTQSYVDDKQLAKLHTKVHTHFYTSVLVRTLTAIMLSQPLTTTLT